MDGSSAQDALALALSLSPDHGEERAMAYNECHDPESQEEGEGEERERKEGERGEEETVAEGDP